MTLDFLDVIAKTERILNDIKDIIDQIALIPHTLKCNLYCVALCYERSLIEWDRGDINRQNSHETPPASHVAFTNEPCVEQQGACYQDTSAPSQEYQPSTEEGDDSEMSEPMQTSETSGEQPGFSGLQGFDISNLQPSQALLDKINGHSSSKANALSNSNQFDQAQVIDQTLYQPKQQQPQIIITQPAARALRGGYKKYKRSARRHFKVRYFSGNRH
ncbi:hypothetical protein K493DRAFT_299992 [Basidiobolus meristosporus CBS 931.73]|uniref:Uncharacterized protein n=1 Tax=Basidiobolus meristosporus CBS 931.73 TaxID=1314790 RepID=A0A1Y1YK46_9FUNG|nr:hypothetical protein K493DRAFT_299992 [Basidiobolus meristosporus CBS 931.73]|eukprot:ORX98352.1 hypothetical protein K493DRAFT_299992 [Basidiobolus meristosporus CBS 931.73]